MSIRQFLTLVGFGAGVFLLVAITLIIAGGNVVSMFLRTQPSANTAAGRPAPVVTPIERGFSKAADDFEASFLGPYVQRDLSFEVLGANQYRRERQVAVAPGVRLSAEQEAAASTVFVDISISADGKVGLPVWPGRSRPSPDDLAAARLAGSWAFASSIGSRPLIVKRVPVRILHFDSGISGVVSVPNGSDCKEPAIEQTYQTSSWGRVVTDILTKVSSHGAVSFSGRGHVLVPVGHATVPPAAVRRTFNSVLTSDLLRAGAAIGVWGTTDSGHGGDFVFRCGTKTLLVVTAEAVEESESFDIHAEVERLTGSDRWVKGNDDTPRVLDKNSASLRNLKVLRGVAQNGSAQGVLELAALGMPMTEGEQKAASATERVNALEIMAQRGKSGALGALLESSIRWSKSQLTDALVVYAGGAVDVGMLERLIKAGGDPAGSYGTSGRTVLMAAAAVGDPAIVRRILRFEKGIHRADRDGDREIHHAVRGHSGFSPRLVMGEAQRLEVLRLLIEAGAHVDARNKLKQTALMLSSRSPAITEFLLRHGADANARDTFGRTPIMLSPPLATAKLLLAHGADVRLKGQHNETALNNNPMPDVVPLLVAAGADARLANDDGRTPLMTTRLSAEATRLLIAKGADVNARDRWRQTALMKCPAPKVAQVLLEAGADPTLRDKFGKTASDYALEAWGDECKTNSKVIEAWLAGHRR